MWGSTMHTPVLRLTIAIGAIGALVAAACVYDAPVTPTASSGPSMQVVAPNSVKSYVINAVDS